MSSNTPLIGRLAEIVGPAGVLSGDAIASLEADWRGVFQGTALCAVRPATTEQVSQVVTLCREAGAPLVPQGGNTGLAGGATPDQSGQQVLLSFGRLAAIRGLDSVGMTITAEAGCILKTAQNAAAESGLLLPVSFAAEGSATIGGIVATNAGGINVLRYGMTRSLVLGLEVVLADGTMVNGLRALRKDNAGFDWKQLFIGSEGTLGIITAAVLRLVSRPRHTLTALVAVADPEAALVLLGQFYDAVGDQVSAFELISKLSMCLVEKHYGLRCPIDGRDWFVLVEIASSLAGLEVAAEAMLAHAIEQGIAQDGTIAATGAQAARLWALREHISEAEGREGGGVKHDVSIPLVGIPAFLAEAVNALDTQLPGARVNAFGHVGDGNIHFNILPAPGQMPRAVNLIVHSIVARHGGSISAEHGVGQYRIDELNYCRTPAELALSTLLKRAIDPANMLNPGKVVRLW